MTRVWLVVLLWATLGTVGGCGVRSHPPSPPISTPEPATAADLLVVPGQRVGPVTAQTSRAALAAHYGEAALADAPIAMGEGTTAPGTLVTPGPGQAFSVVWSDSTQTRPQLARDFGPAWRTPEGLGVGTDYATVAAALGTFGIYGFEWDYGGTLVLAGSRLGQYDGTLWLRLAPAEAAIAEHPEAYRALIGDTVFSSDNPNLAVLDLRVYEMVVYFAPPSPPP
ncbi:MAG TPA: hypothetical protein VLS96_08370 [Nodosilinea sp.]|nr:hypothetical protein [Nodosilinea sp.]